MRWLAVMLAISGCYPDMQVEAAKRASLEHKCPIERIRVESTVADSKMKPEWAYWLNVCGRSRLYRMDASTANRFQDQTQAMGTSQ